MADLKSIAKEIASINSEIKNPDFPTIKLHSFPTGTSMTKAVSKAKKNYKAQLDVVGGIQDKIDKNKTIIDKANDFLNKTNGYRSANDAYEAKVKDVKNLEAKTKKTKDKKTKKQLENDLEKAKKDRKSLYNDLTKIKKSKEGEKEFGALDKARTANGKYQTALTAAQKKLKRLKGVRDDYIKGQQREKAAALKKLQDKNQASINAKIKAQSGKFLAPQTALWRADLKTDSVCFLGEVSPTETDDADGPTDAVDHADPRTNYLRRSGKSLSGTYYLYATGGKDMTERWANLDKHFDSLQKWQLWGLELCIRGFSKWKHVYMTSIAKVSENKDKTALQLSITFSYKKQANLVYRKEKSKTNSKGKTTKKSGSATKKNPGRAKSYTVKSGDTLWAIARKYGTTVSKLEKDNPKAGNLIYPNQKLVIK